MSTGELNNEEIKFGYGSARGTVGHRFWAGSESLDKQQHSKNVIYVTGDNATFTKFEPGFDAGMHTPTNDVWIVVIKGAYLYQR